MKRATAQGFVRNPRSQDRAHNVADDVGTITVMVVRKDRNKFHTKGNITRQLSILDSKVSIVYEAIEAALFGGKHGS